MGIDFKKFFNTFGLWYGSVYGIIFFMSIVIAFAGIDLMNNTVFDQFDLVFLFFVTGLALYKSTK
jgi:hypothetical protein